MPRRVVCGLVLILLPPTAGRGAEPVEIVRDVPAGIPSVTRVVPLTDGPKHHFVGYYGICPWNATGSKLAFLEADFGDRLVKPGETAGVYLLDTATSKSERIAQTAAWNLQQGAMLHWRGTAPDRELVFNDRADGKLVSVILDTKTGARRVLGRPVSALAPDGRTGVGLNYDRMRRVRPVTGYAGGADDGPVEKRPADDGLFAINLQTGASRLLLSVDAACRVEPVPDEIADQPLWLEHPHHNRDSTRLFVMLRAFHPKTKRLVSLPMTVGANGARPRGLLPWGTSGASHYDWLDAKRLVVTREVKPGVWRHLLLTDGEPGVKELAPDVLTRDGHCTFSPDGKWMVTDTYPDEDRRQHLFLLNVGTGKAARVASFHTPAEYRGDWRCDLHPRWDRDSRRVCIDSTHSGIRQVYVVELRLPKQ